SAREPLPRIRHGRTAYADAARKISRLHRPDHQYGRVPVARALGLLRLARYLLEDWTPGLLLGLDKGRDLLRRHVTHESAVGRELALHLRILQRGAQINVYLAHDGVRRAGRRQHHIPGADEEAGKRLGDRRQILEAGEPFQRSVGKPLDQVTLERGRKPG